MDEQEGLTRSRPSRTSALRPPAIVADVGALALTSAVGKDEPQYEHEAEQARPHPPAIVLVRAMEQSGCQIVYITARREALRAATERWLRRHVRTGWSELLMRQPCEGASLRSTEVKIDIYRRHIRDRYRVAFVIDRLQADLVDAWEAYGVPGVHLGEGWQGHGRIVPPAIGVAYPVPRTGTGI